MKNGIPITDVTNPMGKITPGIINLLNKKAKDKINPPNKADRGMKNLWSSPTVNLAIWGATNPTNPIVPTKLTATAEIRDVIKITNRLTLLTSTPILRAFVSSRVMAVNFHAFLNRIIMHINSTANTMKNLVHVVFNKLPKFQNIKLCN